MHRICAVIPVHNEARRIAAVVRKTRRFIAEVIVVDDGSHDNSAEEAERAGARVLRGSRRRGKGRALRAALDAAFSRDFEAAVLLDGDGQHAPEELPRFLRAFHGGAELVVGDRSREFHRMPWSRRLTNRLMTGVLRVVAGDQLRDSQCGFRLLSARLYRALALTSEHFETESEILIQAHRLGIPAVHVPVSAIYDGAEDSKIRPLPDTLRFLGLLVKTAFQPAGEGRMRTTAFRGEVITRFASTSYRSSGPIGGCR